MSVGLIHIAILSAIIYPGIRASKERGSKQAFLVIAVAFGTVALILLLFWPSWRAGAGRVIRGV